MADGARFADAESDARFPYGVLKQDWIAQGWHEFICEEFVFAYEVCLDEATGEQFVWVRDVVHGSLYH